MLVALVLSLVDLPLTRALMTDQATPSPEEPMKPRALTYTEMMNGGRQQMDEAEYARKQEMYMRVEDLEKDMDHLERCCSAQVGSRFPARQSRHDRDRY